MDRLKRESEDVVMEALEDRFEMVVIAPVLIWQDAEEEKEDS